MVILEKEVRMVINQYNINYYQEKLNIPLKNGQRINVPVDILPPTSGVYVTTMCEYCGAVCKKHYRRIIQGNTTGKIACKKCIPSKVLDNCIKKYGVRSTLRLPRVQEKMNNNIMERYGSIEEYHKIQRELWVESIHEKYGEDIRNPLQLPEVRGKANLTMYHNGNNSVFTSKQQKHIAELTQGILNYPIGHYHLDIYLEDKQIGIEYSGAGHALGVKTGRLTEKQFLGKEKARRSYMRNHKIPVIEFVSETDKLPDDEVLLQLIAQAEEQLTHGCFYVKIDLDNL